MELGLCMVVRDEAHQLNACLGSIHDRFDQVVVVDTGSVDGTPRLLQERFGISAMQTMIDEGRCGCLRDPRSMALDNLSTPWVLMLDADERIDRKTLDQLCARPDDPAVAGYFGWWRNLTPDGARLDDYKLFLFRNHLRTVGLVHDVVQIDIRQRDLHATWLEGLEVRHEPDRRRIPSKQKRYRQRLHCAIEQQPDFYRYHWFLGYMEFQAGNLSRAAALLTAVLRARSTLFPVETLNSAVVLAEIHARGNAIAALDEVLERARTFHQRVSGDFEVRINRWFEPWLRQAQQHVREGRPEQIKAQRFAC
jgi:glycosyltransferase involved in cell wall biosynthesis